MLTPVKSSFVGAVLVAKCVLALPELAVRASMCAPTVYTTSYVETITVESVVTAPHSCYTYTITTAQHTNCPAYACPAAPDCIVEETTTLYVPPKDACCATTTTTTTQGPCGSCQIGCATALETVTVTTSAPATTLYKKDTSSTPTSTSSSSTPSSTPCTQTIFRAQPWVEGPTKTDYPYTVTQTVLEDCGGCEYLDVRNINGLGPVVIFTTTVFDPTPTTTTAYACSKTPGY